MNTALTFGTKAETLASLQGSLLYAKVLPQLVVSVEQLTCHEQLKIVQQELVDRGWLQLDLIIRSSSQHEDSHTQSMAGHFESVLGVRGWDAVLQAMHQVAASYHPCETEQHILLQPMLLDVVMSGVVFSRDPSTQGHYWVVNYDSKSGRTDSVTAGDSNDLETYYHAKCRPVSEASDPLLQQLLQAVTELESLFASDALDCEFAFDSQGDCYILQVRPLVGNWQQAIHSDEFSAVLKRIQQRIHQLNRPHPFLGGERTVFGVMPDWNPAEIIGIRPKPLALSLYKELITDSIWAYQRDNYGYRNLRSFPLLINFGGQPYIDVRVSFNSFIPASLENHLANKLADYYISRLVSNPSQHDKVEFEIILSCYTFDVPERLSLMQQAGFSTDEISTIAESLRALTNRIINPDCGLWIKDIHKINQLEQRQQELFAAKLPVLDKIYWIIEDCKRYGTLPFAGLARAGFIAVQMLKSMVSTGILSSENYHSFMASLKTVSSNLNEDRQSMSETDFLSTYGHLRPGTYDITSPRYDEALEHYFCEAAEAEHELSAESAAEFQLSLTQLEALQDALDGHELEHTVLSLFSFLKQAIEGREYAKFVFTRSLSFALKLLREWGAEQGLSKEDLAYLDYNTLHQLYSSSDDALTMVHASIAEGKKQFECTQSIILPALITSEQDVWSFHLPTDEPNYITLKSCEADTCVNFKDETLQGKILLIAGADPGYDWIFSHGIAGFITQYGGVNSHMAIRAAELGIPAVIGAGEKLYRCCTQAKRLRLDCSQKQVRVLA